jgi:hypothetical protein
MTYQEMMDSTGCKVKGFVRGLNEYQGKDRIHYSVDVDVNGCRMPITLRLPKDYRVSDIKPGSVAEFSVIPRLNFAKTGLELHVS